jgi:hypothetical protein
MVVRQWMRMALFALLTVTSACSGSPTAPTPPVVTPPATTTYSISIDSVSVDYGAGPILLGQALDYTAGTVTASGRITVPEGAPGVRVLTYFDFSGYSSDMTQWALPFDWGVYPLIPLNWTVEVRGSQWSASVRNFAPCRCPGGAATCAKIYCALDSRGFKATLEDIDGSFRAVANSTVGSKMNPR